MDDASLAVSDGCAVCTFRVGERLFGIEVNSLREISTNTTVTPIPTAPPAVRGLANLRSRVYLVIDMRPLVGLPPADCTPHSRLIILKAAVAEDMGLLVDHVGHIVRVPRKQMEQRDLLSRQGHAAPGGAAAEFVVGVAGMEQELLMIVDAARLVGAVSEAVR